MLLGIIVFLCRDESVSAVFVFVSNELFDFIDSDTLIDLTAGTGIFAFMRTDTAADCREGIFFLDQFKGFTVFAHGSESDVTLDSDMGRAGCLARSSTCFQSVLSVFTIIDIPSVFTPNGVSDLVVFFNFQRLLGAKLLTELDCIGRAVFDTLTAGDTVGLIDFSMVVASFSVRATEHGGDTDGEARAGTAVADSGGFARAF